jgi:hypothetical protein
VFALCVVAELGGHRVGRCALGALLGGGARALSRGGQKRRV